MPRTIIYGAVGGATTASVWPLAASLQARVCRRQIGWREIDLGGADRVDGQKGDMPIPSVRPIVTGGDAGATLVSHLQRPTPLATAPRALLQFSGAAARIFPNSLLKS